MPVWDGNNVVFLLEEARAVLGGAALSMDRLSARILSERLGGEENHRPDLSVPSIQRASQVAEGSHCPGGLVTMESNLDVTVIKPV